MIVDDYVFVLGSVHIQPRQLANPAAPKLGGRCING